MFWNGEPLSVLAERFQARLKCLCPFSTVDGFPEYQTGNQGLDAKQLCALDATVKAIIQSQYTTNPICCVLVVGHSDVALRKPVPERTRFEDDISQQRADVAWERISAELRRQSLGSHYAIAMMHFELGAGSRSRKHLQPKNESEMRKNRRVEFYFARRQVVRGPCTHCQSR